MRAMAEMPPPDRGDDPELRLERGDDSVEQILTTRPVLARKAPPFRFYTVEELEHDTELAAEIANQTRSDLEWLAALQITPDPLLCTVTA
jgi:hypothetical protein